jgi:hypothetical protein
MSRVGFLEIGEHASCVLLRVGGIGYGTRGDVTRARVENVRQLLPRLAAGMVVHADLCPGHLPRHAST